jgi:LuxR family maltose regulon positive regulatory protein
VWPGGKHLQFLATKVVAPRCPGLIERPRLDGMTAQLPTKRLAVIKGPAGFGKTSLASVWSERLREGGNAVAWLTIDPDDDAPPRFLFYVAQALQRACKALGTAASDMIRESFLAGSDAVMSMLINDLADVDEEVYLFLENYHWIAHPEIHEVVVFFLTHAPSHCHVVITTRAEPVFPLASLRAQNRLLEIDAPALRFDLQETRAFLAQEKLGALAPSSVELMHRKTEGWPASLRIVASTTSRLGKDIDGYLHGLSGTQRPIGAYLTEMLDGLPRDLVSFMLRTAILDCLSPQLCDAVTRTKSGREQLGLMEKRQMLLTPLDREGQWYRYHALLADYLRQRLETDFGDEVPELHRRAADWYASQEFWTEAVQHAIAAGEGDRAVDWIRNCAMSLVKKGDLFTLLGWQRQFPTTLIRGQPEIRLAIAWGLALAMRFEESLRLLRDIEQDADATNSAADETTRCECLAIRSVAVALNDDSETALSVAQDCLDRSTDPWTANVASNVVRFGRLKAGDLKKFYATPWIPYSLDEDRRNVFASVYRRCIQGLAEAQQMHLTVADRYYVEGLELAEQHVGPNSVAAALPASLLASLRYEQGRLDEAESMLIDRLPLISTGAMLECVWSAYAVMAKIAACRIHIERAHALLERAENHGTERGWGRLAAAAVAERARLYFNEGRVGEGAGCVDRLARLAAEYPVSTACAWSDVHRYAGVARAHLAASEGRYDEAIASLKGLRQEAQSVHNHYFATRVATLMSVVLLRADRVNDALNGFRGVLNISAQAGLYQTILDEGPQVGILLTTLQENAERTGGSHELTRYIGRLLAGWQSRHGSQAEPAPSAAIVESLSARERDILQLIAQGLSNKEVARSLVIAPETVKSHVKNIFKKLGAEKRAQAVSRAQSFGIVGTP